MAVAHRSIGSIGDGTRTNTTITAPSGIVDGDILVIIWTHGDNSTITPTPPTGFATFAGYTNGLIADVDPADSGAGEIQLHAWWKRAASESGNYTVTHASAFTEAVCIAYSGALASGDPTTDPNATSNQGTGTATHTATGGTTATDGNMVIFAETTWDDENALTPPAAAPPTFTERYDPGAGNNVLYVADGPMTTAGATGNESVTGIATNGWAATLLFIQAAGGGAATVNRIFFPMGMDGTGGGRVGGNRIH